MREAAPVESGEHRAACAVVLAVTGGRWIKGAPRTLLGALVAEYGLAAVSEAVRAQPGGLTVPVVVDRVADWLSAGAAGVDLSPGPAPTAPEAPPSPVSRPGPAVPPLWEPEAPVDVLSAEEHAERAAQVRAMLRGGGERTEAAGDPVAVPCPNPTCRDHHVPDAAYVDMDGSIMCWTCDTRYPAPPRAVEA